MDYKYVDNAAFNNTKIRLVSDNDGRLFVRKNVHIDSRLAQKLRGISCPYIVKFIEFGSDEDGEYVIEEYVEGDLAAEHQFEKGQAVNALLELCEALEALHADKVIHRDIKPSNIIVTKDGHIKLIDFDASRIEKIIKDKDTQILGTDGFAPPEQFGFSQTDRRSDIYSFGVTMEILLGDDPSPFTKIINKCKAFDPDDRYDSMPKVKKAIRRVMAKRYIAIPIAALSLIVFAVILFTALNHRAPDGSVSDSHPDYQETSDTYSDSYQSSVSAQSSSTQSSSVLSSSVQSSSVQSSSAQSSSAQNSSVQSSSAQNSSLQSSSAQSSSAQSSSVQSSSAQSSSAQSSEPSGIVSFFTRIKNSKGEYEDECNYLFTDDPSVHGTWNVVGTLEKRYLKSFTKGRTDRLNRSAEDLLIQKLSLNSDGSAAVNDSASAVWTRDHFVLRYNGAQYVEKLVYAKVNGTEYLLIEDKTDGYAKTGTTDGYFVFMNVNARKIIYTTVLCDDGHYDDICDYVFYDDPAVHGTWKYEGKIGKDDYDKWAAGVVEPEIYYYNFEYQTKEMIFLSDGTTKRIFNNGHYFPDIWTNGYYLHESGDGKTIEEFFIVTKNGIEYLFIEHKSGDYSREKIANIYNVFSRKSD